MRKMPINKRGSNFKSSNPSILDYYAHNSEKSLASIYHVNVDQYAISDAENTLITDGLNKCSALILKANDKVFLSHFSSREEPGLKEIKNNILQEFQSQFIQNNSIDLKIVMGSNPEETQSIKSIFLLLKELNLLDRFLKRFQEDVRKNIDKIVEVNLMSRQEVYQFLALDKVADVNKLVEFVNKTKKVFQNKNTAILQQHVSGNEKQYAASNQGLKLELHPKYAHEGTVSDYIIDVNVLLEKYHNHSLPNQRFSLFAPNHAREANQLKDTLEQIRLESKNSSRDVLGNFYQAIKPFVDDPPKGGIRLQAALLPIAKEVAAKQKLSFIPQND